MTSNPFVVLDATSSTPELWHFSVVATNGICSVYDTVAVELLRPLRSPQALMWGCAGTDVNVSASGALESRGSMPQAWPCPSDQFGMDRVVRH